MNAVRRVAGRAVPLDRENVDTDQIIPAGWLKQIGRTGYAAGLFEAWRRDGAFVLNDPRYRGATILLAGANFGCGSSREHAAWALIEAGFGAVVAPSFADIFRENALRNGLVPVALPREVVAALMRAVEHDPSLELVVDVERATLSAPRLEASFPLDASARAKLLGGLDDIALTLRHTDAIAAYERARPDWLPSIRQGRAS